MQLGYVGLGNMGAALAGGLLANGIVAADRLAICETLASPYLPRTYSITRSRPSWQKSMSKSGIDTRSGFRKRSKSRL